MIAGDVLFNLRSALDHIAVAMVPSKFRREASFPIEVCPIWFRTTDDSWYATRRAVIVSEAPRKACQLAPSQLSSASSRTTAGRRGRTGGPLSAQPAQQCDKHRQLVTFAGGLLNMICDVNAAGAFTRETRTA